MLVRISNTETWSGELEAEIVWRLTATRSYSEGRVFVPRNSSAHRRAYIDEAGGSIVEITDGHLGTFRGFANVPEITQEGSILTVYGWDRWPGLAPVGVGREFDGVPTGTIVSAGFDAALAGMGAAGLGKGPIARGGPLVFGYRFEDQSFDSVLNDMMDRSGFEWAISNQGVFTWQGLYGRGYEIHLCEDADLVDVQRSGSFDDMVARATSRNNLGHSRTFTHAQHSAKGMWPNHVVVGSSETP